MAEILLVHGAWHGPWCWDGVAERLRRRGHRVRAVRLRGHDRPRGRIWHRGAGQGHPGLAAAPPGGQSGAGPGAVLHPDTPQGLVDEVWGRLQDESYPAFLDTMVVWARPRRVRVPVLVLGAECDGFFTIAELRRTAAAYGIEAETWPAWATT